MTPLTLLVSATAHGLGFGLCVAAGNWTACLWIVVSAVNLGGWWLASRRPTVVQYVTAWMRADDDEREFANRLADALRRSA